MRPLLKKENIAVEDLDMAVPNIRRDIRLEALAEKKRNLEEGIKVTGRQLDNAHNRAPDHVTLCDSPTDAEAVAVTGSTDVLAEMPSRETERMVLGRKLHALQNALPLIESQMTSTECAISQEVMAMPLVVRCWREMVHGKLAALQHLEHILLDCERIEQLFAQKGVRRGYFLLPPLLTDTDRQTLHGDAAGRPSLRWIIENIQNALAAAEKE